MCAKDLGVADKADTERFYSDLVLQHSLDAVIISDPQQMTLWVNPALTAQTGYALADLLGKDAGPILQGPGTDKHAAASVSIACTQRREIRVDMLLHTKSGQELWVDLRVTPVFDPSGRHTHFISTMRDITERKKLEEQNEEMRHAESLRQAERQLLALTSEWLYSSKSVAELLMVIQRAMHTLIPEADGALYIYNDARTLLELATSWGCTPNFAGHILPDECWALRRGRAYAYGQKPIQFTCDHVDKVGTPYFCLPIIAHGETIGLMHIVFDGFEEGGVMRHMRDEVLRNRWEISLICAEQISLAVANVRLRQELHEKSMRDPLTGLWNRRWFMETAEREIARALRADLPLALIAVDVDHFKSFNDQFGHDAGDQVLTELGRVMQRISDDEAHPCRIGGEEFNLLCPGHDHHAARDLAERMREAVGRVALAVNGQSLPRITISAGFALLQRDGQTVLELMNAADRALYQAKAQGRDRVIGSEPASPSTA